MTILQWLPLEKDDDKNLFLECKDIKNSCTNLCINLGVFLKTFNIINCSTIYYNINVHENKLFIEVTHFSIKQKKMFRV